MKPQVVVGGVLLTAFLTGVVLPAETERPHHTPANVFLTAYSTGTSAERLVYSEIIEFLKDTVSENAPVNPVTFTLV